MGQGIGSWRPVLVNKGSQNKTQRVVRYYCKLILIICSQTCAAFSRSNLQRLHLFHISWIFFIECSYFDWKAGYGTASTPALASKFNVWLSHVTWEGSHTWYNWALSSNRFLICYKNLLNQFLVQQNYRV